MTESEKIYNIFAPRYPTMFRLSEKRKTLKRFLMLIIKQMLIYTEKSILYYRGFIDGMLIFSPIKYPINIVDAIWNFADEIYTYLKK